MKSSADRDLLGTEIWSVSDDAVRETCNRVNMGKQQLNKVYQRDKGWVTRRRLRELCERAKY